VCSAGAAETEVIAMMLIKRHARMSSIAWSVLLAAMVACYVMIAAGLFGVIGAPRGSLAVFSAAMIGFVAAFIYLAAALRELRSHRTH
jgi:hypothetical protein